MVKLTLDFIARRTSGYTKKKREESMRHYLRRLTHLYLEDKNIDDIGDNLSSCPHLIVLYLYDNQLTRIPDLSLNTNLTHLYLQNNKIRKMENLASLEKLTKLYIGGNAIAVVEGLQNLVQLQELHIENQKLPAGEKLLFDPRSINAISGTLSVLNVSGNRLTSLGDLQSLRQLTQLLANDNQLSDMKEMAELLSSWRRITRIDLLNNPLCHKTKYPDRIIVLAPLLEIFDGKEVTDTRKQFLKNWQANKDAVKQRMLVQQSASYLNMADVQSRGDAQFTPFQQPLPRSAYVMPALPHQQYRKILSTKTRSHAADGRSEARDSMTESRYLNTYNTYYHDTRPATKAYPTISLLNMDSQLQQ